MYEWTTGTELCHHGIKDMKWYIRRFQNYDGTLTPEGRERYRKKRAENDIKKYGDKSKATKAVEYRYGLASKVTTQIGLSLGTAASSVLASSLGTPLAVALAVPVGSMLGNAVSMLIKEAGNQRVNDILSSKTSGDDAGKTQDPNEHELFSGNDSFAKRVNPAKVAQLKESYSKEARDYYENIAGKDVWKVLSFAKDDASKNKLLGNAILNNVYNTRKFPNMSSEEFSMLKDAFVSANTSNSARRRILDTASKNGRKEYYYELENAYEDILEKLNK